MTATKTRTPTASMTATAKNITALQRNIYKHHHIDANYDFTRPPTGTITACSGMEFMLPMVRRLHLYLPNQHPTVAFTNSAPDFGYQFLSDSHQAQTPWNSGQTEYGNPGGYLVPL